MPTLTPKLGLKKPLGNETVSRAAYNENLDILDQAAASQADLDAHKNRTDNPHNVTLAQVGGAPASHVGAGGSAHATATGSAAGFMSATDKAKLDGIQAGAAALTSSTPAAETVGAAGAVGTATAAARADHVHPMPGTATTGAAGFMSATDKAKLDGIASGATNTPLASTAPTTQNYGDAASVGVATTAARADHKHGMPANPVPPGVILPYGGSTPPSGWLECNGAAVSRTTYAALFAAIGTTFGAGDGSTTFNLPDLRGEFIRGWDHGRGVDSGRVLGSYQDDAFQGHWHNIWTGRNDTAQYHGGGSLYGHIGGGDGRFNANYDAGNNFVRAPVTDSVNGTPRTAWETRPRNKAVMFIIKY